VWDKNFCLALFLNFYNQLFWLENNLNKNQSLSEENLQKEEKIDLSSSSNQKVENSQNSIKNQEKLAKNLETEKIINNKNLESLFASENELSEVDQIQVQNQINFWLQNQTEITAKLSELTNEKTLITTKAILICAYLEIENFKFQKNNPKVLYNLESLEKPKTMTDNFEENPKENPKNLFKSPTNLVNFSVQNPNQNPYQNNLKSLEENIETAKLRKTEEKSESAKIISKYLKLAQNYVDNKNTSLIHAILTKLCVDL